MMYETFFSKNYEHFEKDTSLVILGNSLEIMKSMKRKSVDLIFADEPYNIGKNFGNNFDNWATDKEYLDWNKKWISEAMEILSDNGTMYLMTSTQYMPFVDVFLQSKYNVVSRIVWTYDSSGVQSKKNYGSLYEPILMVTKNKNVKYTFNSQDILIDAKTGSKRKLIDYRKNPPRPYNTKKVPGNVWTFSRVRFKMKEYENHPTQKPEALLERVIKASSNKGDVVFDPFAGSFTTGAVAKRLSRKNISIDLNEEYLKIGIRRLGIDDVYKNKKLEKVKKRKTNNKSKKSRIRIDNMQMDLDLGTKDEQER